jgi:hypothetical protein
MGTWTTGCGMFGSGLGDRRLSPPEFQAYARHTGERVNYRNSYRLLAVMRIWPGLNRSG